MVHRSPRPAEKPAMTRLPGDGMSFALDRRESLVGAHGGPTSVWRHGCSLVLQFPGRKTSHQGKHTMQHAPYGLGFSTLDTETRIDDLPIRGTVPPWLQGTLLRTGPAKFEVGSQRYSHWFDGLAMLRRFAFAGGRVAYANCFLRSRSYREAMARGTVSQRESATDPCRTLFQHVTAFFFRRPPITATPP